MNLSNRYPFIYNFVHAMQSVDAQNYVTSNDTDLKSLLNFFQMYIISCRKIKSAHYPLSTLNIVSFMEDEFDIWKQDSVLYNTSNSINSITKDLDGIQ
jgi:hypothetical protein